VGDIQPLLGNANFRKDAEYQIQTAQNAAKQASLARTLTDDYMGTISQFGTLISSAKAIAKKFPEVGTEMTAIMAAAKAAMGKVKNNPVAVAPVPQPAPKPAPIPVPSPAPVKA
jgi:hypothetical protein